MFFFSLLLSIDSTPAETEQEKEAFGRGTLLFKRGWGGERGRVMIDLQLKLTPGSSRRKPHLNSSSAHYYDSLRIDQSSWFHQKAVSSFYFSDLTRSSLIEKGERERLIDGCVCMTVIFWRVVPLHSIREGGWDGILRERGMVVSDPVREEDMDMLKRRSVMWRVFWWDSPTFDPVNEVSISVSSLFETVPLLTSKPPR